MGSDTENDLRQLLLKAERFCSYRERCSYEIKQKMKELGADEKATEKIINSLTENDFLNDERFAQLFTSGKFRIKRWGKNKIRAELRMKKVSDSIISNALDCIDKAEYQNTIQHLINKKEKEVRKEKPEVRSQKTFRYLLSKGFESELIWKYINLKI